MVHTVGFEWGPNTRGTFDIIWSCVLVLITAVWTVVHINIPAYGEGFWRVVLRRLRWGCVSVFAPDFLTLVAAAQWDSASKSLAKMQTLPQLRDDQEKWRLEHTFYANSGGFQLQCHNCKAFPVNAKSLHYLVSKGYIDLPNITVSEIRDKSKADVFAKGAAIFQGLWLVVQSIARTAQGLPMSQLELFTLAFVVSTVMSYFFWWRKPQHVSTSTLLLCDYSIARIRGDAGLPPDGWNWTPMDWVEEEGQTWTRRDMFRRFDLEEAARGTTDSEKVGASLRREVVMAKTSMTDVTASSNTSLRLGTGDLGENEIKTVDRMQSDMSGKTISVSVSTSPSAYASAEQPVQRVPDDAIMPSQLPLKVLAGLIIPSMIHSCIHLLGWNLHYPSTFEKQLWRASAVTLTAMSCLAVGAVRVLHLVGYQGRYNLVWVWVTASSQANSTTGDTGPRRDKKRNGRLASLTVWEALLTLATLGLVLARLFIIVEVIISLRSQPQDVYVSVNWLGFIPHV